MNERIKELAVQAIQETAKQGVHDGLAMSLDALERFAELVRQDERNLQRTKKEWSDHDRAIAAAEREAIEKIVKRLRPEIVGAPNDPDSHQQWCDSAAAFSRFESVIAAIRARSKHD